MATKDESVAPIKPIFYQDFEPYCLWLPGEGSDSLELHLQDFKKEQLGVKVKDGILVVNGERPMTTDRIIRFRKEVKLPRHYRATEIHAKFSSQGVLTVLLPKQTTHPSSSSKDSGSNPGNVGLPSAYLVGSGNTSSFMAKINRRVGVQVLVVALAMAFGAFVYRSWFFVRVDR